MHQRLLEYITLNLSFSIIIPISELIVRSGRGRGGRGCYAKNKTTTTTTWRMATVGWGQWTLLVSDRFQRQVTFQARIREIPAGFQAADSSTPVAINHQRMVLHQPELVTSTSRSLPLKNVASASRYPSAPVSRYEMCWPTRCHSAAIHTGLGMSLDCSFIMHDVECSRLYKLA